MEPPNGLELSCPAEAGRLSRWLSRTPAGEAPGPIRQPAGLPQILAVVQGFKELLGGAKSPSHSNGTPTPREQLCLGRHTLSTLRLAPDDALGPRLAKLPFKLRPHLQGHLQRLPLPPC